MAIRFSNTFLLRKLHQLTGIVPLGMFFFVHLYTNSTALNGAKVFNEHVGGIHEMPYLLFIEIGGIFLPLLFHSVYGISAELRFRKKLVLHLPACNRHIPLLFPALPYPEF
jgi:succinate dehydrogenase / fumarate reductase cytochrome b subunit